MQGKCSNSAKWNDADGYCFLTLHVTICPFSHKKIKPHYQGNYISWMEKKELYGNYVPLKIQDE
jgi:hypothetical protein